ncbi:MAG: N-formylglutamate amidohydrolase [Xanthomonadales bacterium]|nr:N-formylglutamate amidohydrolase [Xanthomonadales bacterium]
MPGRKPPVSALITCEHASNEVPARWRHLFVGHEAELASHRGWDAGTAELGHKLADRLEAPLLAGRATRLLIDLNRSAGHPRRYSEWTRKLPRAERARIEREWWLPHWRAYRSHLENLPGRVIHIACHSFTPVFDGKPRRLDIGLLYDSARQPEKAFCLELRRLIEARRPDLRVRMNAPYRGTANGLGQQHRRQFPADRLITIELEIGQHLVARSDWSDTQESLVSAVAEAVRASVPRHSSCNL